MNAVDSPLEALAFNLDSPLEALAFNYLSFAFSTAVDNIWPCLAVITAAAISFWKIRGAAGFTAPAKLKHPVDCRINDPRSTASATATATAVNLVLESDGCGSDSSEGRRRRIGRRGKFTVYYESEGEERDLAAEEKGVKEECCWGEDWKRGLRMRVGEDLSLGWYRDQDLTVLDGNVVKLWGGYVGCGGREFNQLVTAVW